MKTTTQKEAEILADWNSRKVSSDETVYKIWKLHKRSALKEWLKQNPVEH